MWFEIDEDLIRTVISMDGDPRWESFKQRISDLSKDMSNQTLHSMPSADDHNYMERHNIQRGISICLDVLTNVMSNAREIGDDLKENAARAQMMEEASKAL